MAMKALLFLLRIGLINMSHQTVKVNNSSEFVSIYSFVIKCHVLPTLKKYSSSMKDVMQQEF